MQNIPTKIIFDGNEKRIDVFLAETFSNMSRSYWQSCIESGFVLVNNLNIKPKYKLESGDIINIDTKNVTHNNKIDEEIKATNIPLDIVFENANLLVINKQPNLTTHPGAGNKDNTMVNALLNKYKNNELSDIGGMERLGIVHRLDKDTSGLIIVAKNNISHTKLAKQIEIKSCKRKYLALCYGVFVPSSGTIETGISPQPKNHNIMQATEVDAVNSKLAITNYRTIEVFCGGIVSLVEFELETGRTHQIRVHALHKKHPIIGDKTYYNDKYRYDIKLLPKEIKEKVLNFNRQALHAFYIKFKDPILNEKIEIQIDLPEDIQQLASILKSSK